MSFFEFSWPDKTLWNSQYQKYPGQEFICGVNGGNMKQLDLIVAALKVYTEIVATAGTDYRVCCGADIEFDHLDDCNGVKALAAAKELRENLNLERFAEFVRSTEIKPVRIEE